jgi:hypothetical protein
MVQRGTARLVIGRHVLVEYVLDGSWIKRQEWFRDERSARAFCAQRRLRIVD